MKEDTILPKFICVACHDSLQSAYNFLSKVNASQNTLERYLDNKSAIDIVVEDSTQSFDDCKSLEQSKISKKLQESHLLTCCNEEFTTKTLYNKHVRSHSIAKRNYSCLSCDKKYVSNYELEVNTVKYLGS